MADVYFHCVKCDKALAADSAAVGDFVSCVDCGHRMVVPKPVKTVTCFCGTDMLVAEARGKTHTCLKCGAEITVSDTPDAPSSYDDVYEKPRLMKTRPEHIHRCPNCGEALAGGAVVCTACGFDARTGRKLKPRKRITVLPETRRAVVRALVFVAILGLIYAYREPLRARASEAAELVLKTVRPAKHPQQPAPAKRTIMCPVCAGGKLLKCTQCMGFGTVEKSGRRATCATCDGAGHVTCRNCDGAGRVSM